MELRLLTHLDENLGKLCSRHYSEMSPYGHPNVVPKNVWSKSTIRKAPGLRERASVIKSVLKRLNKEVKMEVFQFRSL